MAKKKKLRKSQRPGFKPKPMYSVHKMFQDTEKYCHLKGEMRQIFIESLSDYFLKWSKQQHDLGKLNGRAVEITDKVDELQRKGNKLKEEAEKTFGKEKFKESKLKEAEENFNKARFMLDFTVHHLGKTHKDFFQDDKWNVK